MPSSQISCSIVAPKLMIRFRSTFLMALETWSVMILENLIRCLKIISLFLIRKREVCLRFFPLPKVYVGIVFIILYFVII